MAVRRRSVPPQAGARARLAVLFGMLGCLLPFPACGEGELAGHSSFSGARVCLDEDASLTCDAGEPATETDSAGGFRLAREGPSSSLLLARVEPGNDNLIEGRPAAAPLPLVAPEPRGDRLTVWTTLAWSRIAAGTAATYAEAREQVRASFGLPDDFDAPGGPTDAGVAQRQRALTQLALHLYAQEYGRAAERDEPGRARAAAEATLASATRLEGLLDWMVQQQGAPPPSNAGPQPDQVFWADYDRIPLSTEMAYGIGLDAASLGLAGSCLASTTPAPGLCENRGEYTFELVESKDDVATHLEIGAGAKASVSVGSFDVVSVSGAFRFLKDTEMRDDHLYIAIRDERVLCGYPVSATLTDAYSGMYATDYQSFRSVCGDRYLASITTGGYFYALIEITLAKDQDIEQERLNLSGKVLGVKVYDKTWTDTAREISLRYQTSTRVVSNFFSYENSSLTMAQVLQKYDEFLARIQGSECQGPTASTTCGYLASFATYATATTQAAAPDPVLATYLPNMRSYEAFAFQADDILDRLAQIVTHPQDYNIGTAVDELHAPNDWSLAGLVALEQSVEQKRGEAVSRWSSCHADIYSCTRSADTLHFSDDPLLPTWLDVQLALPEKKFFLPADCRELSDLLGIVDDDAYDLYLGGVLDQTYAAECLYMATWLPRTYLVLGDTSTSPDFPSYNHVWIATGPGTGVGKIFTRLLVTSRRDPVTGQPLLELARGQDDFYRTSTAASSTELELLRAAPLLSARARAGGTATANLSLAGTALHLAADPVFQLAGNEQDYQVRFTVSADRKSVDVVLEPVPGAVPGDADAVVSPVAPLVLAHD